MVVKYVPEKREMVENDSKNHEIRSGKWKMLVNAIK
jgi:hypothetical protein